MSMPWSRRSVAPAVSAVVVHCDDPDRVYACVDVLGGLSDPDRGIEIVIVEDGAPELVRPRLGAGVLRVRSRESNRGRVAAANEGAVCSRGAFLLFLEPHLALSSSDLASLLETLEEDGRIAAVGPAPAMASVRRTADRALGRVVMDRVSAFAAARAGRQMHEAVPAAWLSGEALVVRADVFRALGGFDESLCEHTAAEDWCRRARRRGYRVAYVSRVGVADATAPTEACGQSWWHPRACCLQSRTAVLERHLGWTLARAFRCAAALGRSWRRLTAVPVALARRGRGKAGSGRGGRPGHRAEGTRVVQRRHWTARKPEALRP